MDTHMAGDTIDITIKIYSGVKIGGGGEVDKEKFKCRVYALFRGEGKIGH